MKNLKLNFVQKFVMKICVFTALVASSSAIGLKDQAKNPHLTATYILNDALSMVDQIATKSRNEESKTNTDYVKELDRRIKDITWERKHVQDGEVQATTMLHGGNLTQEDKDRIAAENKFAQEELAAQAANIKAEEEAKLLEMGYFDFIAKPINPVRLVARIRHALRIIYGTSPPPR